VVRAQQARLVVAPRLDLPAGGGGGGEGRGLVRGGGRGGVGGRPGGRSLLRLLRAVAPAHAAPAAACQALLHAAAATTCCLLPPPTAACRPPSPRPRRTRMIARLKMWSPPMAMSTSSRNDSVNSPPSWLNDTSTTMPSTRHLSSLTCGGPCGVRVHGALATALGAPERAERQRRLRAASARPLPLPCRAANPLSRVPGQPLLPHLGVDDGHVADRERRARPPLLRQQHVLQPQRPGVAQRRRGSGAAEDGQVDVAVWQVRLERHRAKHERVDLAAAGRGAARAREAPWRRVARGRAAAAFSAVRGRRRARRTPAQAGAPPCTAARRARAVPAAPARPRRARGPAPPRGRAGRKGTPPPPASAPARPACLLRVEGPRDEALHVLLHALPPLIGVQRGTDRADERLRALAQRRGPLQGRARGRARAPRHDEGLRAAADTVTPTSHSGARPGRACAAACARRGPERAVRSGCVFLGLCVIMAAASVASFATRRRRRALKARAGRGCGSHHPDGGAPRSARRPPGAG
jgi:hypothetical protein